MVEWLYVCVDRWVGGWDGWVGRLVPGWMRGCMDG